MPENIVVAGNVSTLCTDGHVSSSIAEEIASPTHRDLISPLKHTEIKAAETTKAVDLHLSNY
jgi:hypothetical protein